MENETKATVRRWPIIFIFATYSLTSAFQVSLTSKINPKVIVSRFSQRKHIQNWL